MSVLIFVSFVFPIVYQILNFCNLIFSNLCLGFCDDLVVKNPLAKHETWVQSLGQEDPLEQEMAAHSSILIWEVPGTEELDGLQSMGLQRVRHS